MKMIRTLTACALVFGVVSTAHAASVNDAVRAALLRSPEVAEAKATMAAVGEELNQARSLFAPTIDLEAFAGPQFVDRPNSLSVQNNGTTRTSRQISAVARWTLFNGYFRANEKYRQATRLHGSGFRIFEAAEVVALNTVEAYVDVIRHRNVLAASDQNIRQHQLILGRARNQLEGGAATQGEVEIALERLVAAQALRTEVLRALGDVEADYIRLVGAKPNRLKHASRPGSFPRTLDGAIAIAREQHPTIEAARLAVEAADAEVEQAASSFYPNVGVEARGSHGFDIGGTPGQFNDASVRVVMNWRLYDGGLRKAQTREQVARLGVVEAQLDRFRLDVDRGVRQSWNTVVTNDQRMAALRRQLTQSERVISSYYEEYEAGLRTLLDILDAQNARFNVQFELASSEAIATFSRYQVVGATGRLLDEFGLKHLLPEPEVRAENIRIHRANRGSLLEPLRK